MNLQRKDGRGDKLKHLVIWAILLIELFPLYVMMQVSFKDNAEFLQNPWLPLNPQDWHLENWSFAIKLVGPYILNTGLVAVVGTASTLTFALLAAYFFARYPMPGSKILWAVFMVLLMLPSVANLIPLFSLLRNLSLLNSLWALVAVATAGGQAFNLFILKGFIDELPRDLFEAAEIDGANHIQQLRSIVLPLTSPILGTLGILSFLAIWNDFLLPLIVLRDQSLFTLGVGLIYLDGEYVKEWGKVMAAYFTASIPLIILFTFTMRLFVKGLSQGAIKG